MICHKVVSEQKRAVTHGHFGCYGYGKRFAAYSRRNHSAFCQQQMVKEVMKKRQNDIIAITRIAPGRVIFYFGEPLMSPNFVSSDV